MCYLQECWSGSDLSCNMTKSLHWIQWRVHLGPETIPHSPECGYCLRILYYYLIHERLEHKYTKSKMFCALFASRFGLEYDLKSSVHCITHNQLLKKKVNFTFVYGQQRKSVNVSGCESKIKWTPPHTHTHPFSKTATRKIFTFKVIISHENLTHYSERKQKWEVGSLREKLSEQDTDCSQAVVGF